MARPSEFIALATQPGQRPVFRQSHRNADGREVLLYGYGASPRTPVGPGLQQAAGQSELRWHPLRREWSVYAAARQARTFKPGAAEDPLAPTRSGGPTTEIPFTDFEIAIFENRFPSLKSESDLPPGAPVVERSAALGRCEVIVYGPEAEGSLATLGDDRRRLLITAWIDRYRSMFAMGLDYVLPFENRGDEVGVTLHHPHGQVYGFGFMPAVQRVMVQAFADGFDLSKALGEWRADYRIAEAGGMDVVCPPFARFPYETWIAPRTVRDGPWSLTQEEYEGFAHCLGEITRRYDAFFGRPTPYMLTLHAAPRDFAGPFHFTAQFYPLLRAPDRVKYLAAVEQATGVFTVDVLPERAASELRAV